MSAESALIAAFAARLGAVDIVSLTATPWHSATFSGTRHAITLAARNAPNVYVFAREIAETDIPLPGGFVADVAVSACPAGDARRLKIDVLTIEA